MVVIHFIYKKKKKWIIFHGLGKTDRQTAWERDERWWSRGEGQDFRWIQSIFKSQRRVMLVSLPISSTIFTNCGLFSEPKTWHLEVMFDLTRIVGGVHCSAGELGRIIIYECSFLKPNFFLFKPSFQSTTLLLFFILYSYVLNWGC